MLKRDYDFTYADTFLAKENAAPIVDMGAADSSIMKLTVYSGIA